ALLRALLPSPTLSRSSGCRGGACVDRSDEAVPAPRQRLNKPGRLRPVPERTADLEDAAFQHLRFDVRLGPHRREEFLLRHPLARSEEPTSELQSLTNL